MLSAVRAVEDENREYWRYDLEPEGAIRSRSETF